MQYLKNVLIVLLTPFPFSKPVAHDSYHSWPTSCLWYSSKDLITNKRLQYYMFRKH